MEKTNQAIVPHTTLPNGYIQNNLPRKISKEICFHMLATKPVLKSEDNRYIYHYIDLVALEIDPQSLGRLEQTCKSISLFVQQLKQDDTFAQRIIARHNNLFANEWCLKNFHQLFRQEETSFSKTKNLHELYFKTIDAYLEMSVSNFRAKLLNKFFDLSDEAVSKIETATDMNTLHGILKEAKPDVAELIKKPTAELKKELLEGKSLEYCDVILLGQPTLLSLLKALQPSIIPSYRSRDATMVQISLDNYPDKDKPLITPNYQQLIEHNLINEYYIVHSHLGDNYQPDKKVHEKFAREPQIAFDFAHCFGKRLLSKVITEDAREGEITNLISLGVNPNIPFNAFGKRPLHVASEQGKLNAARELLAQKANPNAKDVNSQTPLHNAANNRRKDIINLFLNNGADVNAQNIYGETALHICANEGIFSQAKNLLAQKANPNAKDVNSQTPLHNAINKREFYIINLLLNNGADVNAQNIYGETALHMCINESMLSEAENLLERKANIDAKTTKGMTALGLAKQLNKKDFIELINTYISQ